MYICVVDFHPNEPIIGSCALPSPHMDDFICKHSKFTNLVSIKITTHLLECYYSRSVLCSKFP